MSKKNTIKKYKIKRDCWDLDKAFLIWLHERLPVYLHDAGVLVDLNYHKFIYHEKEYTQRELVVRMIHLLDSICAGIVDLEEEYNSINEVLEIWSLVFHAMWW